MGLTIMATPASGDRPVDSLYLWGAEKSERSSYLYENTTLEIDDGLSDGQIAFHCPW